MGHVLRILTGREPLYTNNPIPNDSHREIFTKPYGFKSACILLCLTLVRGQISTSYIVGSYRCPFASLGFVWRDHSSSKSDLQIRPKSTFNRRSLPSVLPVLLPYNPPAWAGTKLEGTSVIIKPAMMLQPAKYAKLRIIWIRGSKILRKSLSATSYSMVAEGEKKDEDTQQSTRGVEVSFKGQCHDPIISDRSTAGSICTAGRATRKDAWL